MTGAGFTAAVIEHRIQPDSAHTDTMKSSALNCNLNSTKIKITWPIIRAGTSPWQEADGEKWITGE